jgi:hypothetical protein
MSITNEPLSEMKFDMEMYCKHGYTFCMNFVCKLTSIKYPVCEMFNVQSIHVTRTKPLISFTKLK